MKSDLFIEEWKDVEGYEGLYQVSNLEKVMNVKTGKILKPYLYQTGYYGVVLSKNNIKKHHFIHRLVAQAFIPNPENKPCINHINECRWDSPVWNLEWCTHKENNNYGKHSEKISVSKTGKLNPKRVSKPVIQYTLDGQFVAEYPSMAEAQRLTGIFQTSIGQCCKGNNRYNTSGGYKWKFKE